MQQMIDWKKERMLDVCSLCGMRWEQLYVNRIEYWLLTQGCFTRPKKAGQYCYGDASFHRVVEVLIVWLVRNAKVVWGGVFVSGCMVMSLLLCVWRAVPNYFRLAPNFFHAVERIMCLISGDGIFSSLFLTVPNLRKGMFNDDAYSKFNGRYQTKRNENHMQSLVYLCCLTQWHGVTF